MSPAKRKLIGVLLTLASLVVAAGAAYAFYRAASAYSSFFVAIKSYCIFWFVAAVLCVIAGIYAASPVGLTAAVLGFVSFAGICILDPAAPAILPRLTLFFEIAAPAFFVTGWFIITIAAFQSPSRAVRGFRWVWLTAALTVLFVFPSYNYGRFTLYCLRSQDLVTAADATLRIVDRLSIYHQAHGSYPAELETAGVEPALTVLPYRDQKIRYFAGKGMFILTFEDPMQSGSVVYSWDTSRDGWYPADPRDALSPVHHNLFLGVLHPN